MFHIYHCIYEVGNGAAKGYNVVYFDIFEIAFPRRSLLLYDVFGSKQESRGSNFKVQR